jgi:hypothetical protein
MSFGLKTCARGENDCITFNKFLCAITTPFGIPVEPEVYIITDLKKEKKFTLKL